MENLNNYVINLDICDESIILNEVKYLIICKEIDNELKIDEMIDLLLLQCELKFLTEKIKFS